MTECLSIVREHEESRDPRHAGQCVRCGKPFTPPAEPSFERNVEQERELTRDAAAFAPYVQEPEAVADALRSFAERRAHDGPVRMPEGRDLPVEGLEEAADLSNYAAWEYRRVEAEGRTDEDFDRERMLLRRALAAAVEAYDALSLYRAARRDVQV